MENHSQRVSTSFPILPWVIEIYTEAGRRVARWAIPPLQCSTHSFQQRTLQSCQPLRLSFSRLVTTRAAAFALFSAMCRCLTLLSRARADRPRVLAAAVFPEGKGPRR